MALKDKIITYNMQIAFMDYYDDEISVDWLKEYNNISRIAVDYFTNWYNLYCDNVSIYVEENKVK